MLLDELKFKQKIWSAEDPVVIWASYSKAEARAGCFSMKQRVEIFIHGTWTMNKQGQCTSRSLAPPPVSLQGQWIQQPSGSSTPFYRSQFSASTALSFHPEGMSWSLAGGTTPNISVWRDHPSVVVALDKSLKESELQYLLKTTGRKLSFLLRNISGKMKGASKCWSSLH